jgi:hypothetical protein
MTMNVLGYATHAPTDTLALFLSSIAHDGSGC